VDTASDTSSARERRFDELLGEEPQYEQMRPSPYRGAAHSHKLHEIGVATVRAKQEWLKMERDRMLMQELSQLTQRPNITAQARNRASKGEFFYDHAQKWQEQRREHVERLSFELAEQERRTLRHVPFISPNSKAMCDASQYENPIDGWDSRFAQYTAKKYATELHQPVFQPTISEYAKSRPADDEPAAERLYREAELRKSRLATAEAQQREKEMLDPVTMQPLFSPMPMARHHQDPAQMPRYLEPRRTAAPASPKDREATHRPAINPLSVALVHRNGATDVVARLYQPRKKEAAAAATAQQQQQAKAHGKDASKARRSEMTTEFLNRNLRDEIARKQRRSQVVQDTTEARELSACTFKPKISHRSKEIFFSRVSAPSARADAVEQYEPEPGLTAFHPPPSGPRMATVEDEFRHVAGAALGPPRPVHTGDGLRPVAAPGEPVLNEYITNFEQQMQSVLDQWRKLEDV
jgi:hypothetical protein